MAAKVLIIEDQTAFLLRSRCRHDHRQNRPGSGAITPNLPPAAAVPANVSAGAASVVVRTIIGCVNAEILR